MSRDIFKQIWKELRVAGVSYSSLNDWLQAISKYFERPGIASGLTNDFSENPKKSFSMRSQNRNGTIAIAK